MLLLLKSFIPLPLYFLEAPRVSNLRVEENMKNAEAGKYSIDQFCISDQRRKFRI